jgi:hypothetical protein
MTARKEIRSMKARRSSVVACGHRVEVGDRIISRGQGWRRAWICMPCALTELPRAGLETITEERRP